MFTSLLLSLDPDWAPLALRIALGIALVFHGYPKLFKMRDQFAGWLETLGFKPGWVWAWIVAITEFVGGALLVLGFFTEIAAIFIAGQMLIIMLKLKWGKDPYIMGQDGKGWELDMIYFAIALSLIFSGPGFWSLDWYIMLNF